MNRNCNKANKYNTNDESERIKPKVKISLILMLQAMENNMPLLMAVLTSTVLQKACHE